MGSLREMMLPLAVMYAFGKLYTTDGVTVTVGIVVNNTQKGTLASKVRTIHAKSDFATQITDKSVMFLKNNKKEINAWFQSLGIDVPLGGPQLGVIRSIDLNNIVTQPNGEVNTTDGYTLSF